MIATWKTASIVFVVLCAMFIPVLALGQSSGEPQGGGSSGTVRAPGSSGVVQGPPGSPARLENPLGDTTLENFFLKIIDILIIFALPVIVFFIILAGFKYVTARGNTSEIEAATTALTWAIVGGVIILGARLILTVIQGTVSSLRM